MAFFIRAVDGKTVTDVWDTLPPAGQDGWREAIEVKPAKTKPDYEQYYGQHYFDLTKTPAGIVWPLMDFSPEECAEHKANYEAQQLARYTNVVQKYMDDFAKTRNYDNIASAVSYETSQNPQFAAEGVYCRDQRDAIWTACYTVLAEVEAGTRAVPTPAELLALMPALVWPV